MYVRVSSFTAEVVSFFTQLKQCLGIFAHLHILSVSQWTHLQIILLTPIYNYCSPFNEGGSQILINKLKPL